jgi:hypothetical protein
MAEEVVQKWKPLLLLLLMLPGKENEDATTTNILQQIAFINSFMVGIIYQIWNGIILLLF